MAVKKKSSKSPKLVDIKLNQEHRHRGIMYPAGAVLEGIPESKVDFFEGHRIGYRVTRSTGGILTGFKREERPKDERAESQGDSPDKTE